MSQLNQLLKQASEIKSKIVGCTSRIADLRSRLTEAESTEIDYASIDTADEAAMTKLASRKLAVEILPKQIEQVDQAKGDAVRELITVGRSLRRLISELSAAEQQKIVAEIAGVLAPYSTLVPSVNGQNLDPATGAGWGMPIITTLAVATTFQLQPPVEDNVPREIRAEVFDRDALEFANEAIGIGERYLSNGQTFVLEFFRKKKR